jgi:hypothetical protein
MTGPVILPESLGVRAARPYLQPAPRSRHPPPETTWAQRETGILPAALYPSQLSGPPLIAAFNLCTVCCPLWPTGQLINRSTLYASLFN